MNQSATGTNRTVKSCSSCSSSSTFEKMLTVVSRGTCLPFRWVTTGTYHQFPSARTPSSTISKTMPCPTLPSRCLTAFMTCFLPNSSFLSEGQEDLGDVTQALEGRAPVDGYPGAIVGILAPRSQASQRPPHASPPHLRQSGQLVDVAGQRFVRRILSPVCEPRAARKALRNGRIGCIVRPPAGGTPEAWLLRFREPSSGEALDRCEFIPRHRRATISLSRG